MIEAAPTPPDPMTPRQRARIEALRTARAVLAKSGFASGEVAPFTVEDIVDVAEYVLTGKHPAYARLGIDEEEASDGSDT